MPANYTGNRTAFPMAFVPGAGGKPRQEDFGDDAIWGNPGGTAPIIPNPGGEGAPTGATPPPVYPTVPTTPPPVYPTPNYVPPVTGVSETPAYNFPIAGMVESPQGIARGWHAGGQSRREGRAGAEAAARAAAARDIAARGVAPTGSGSTPDTTGSTPAPEEPIDRATRGAEIGYVGILDEVNRIISGINAYTNRSERVNDLMDVFALGPAYKQAIRESNPELYDILDKIQAKADNLGPTDIEAELQRQAMQELSRGDRASEAELFDATQDARAGFAARGTFRSNPSAVAEVLNRYDVRKAMEDRRRNFAASTNTAFREGMGQDRAYELSAAGLRGAASFNPIAAVLGRGNSNNISSTGIVNAAMGMGGGAAGNVNSGGLNANDVYDSNFNAANAANIANANNSAAAWGGLTSALGGIWGDYFSKGG